MEDVNTVALDKNGNIKYKDKKLPGAGKSATKNYTPGKKTGELKRINYSCLKQIP